MENPVPAKSKTNKRRSWVSLVPYGLNEQHPNAYKEILSTIWENRDRLGYAYRILNHGCCDGCSLGTTGMRDWAMTGVHLCAVRLNLLRLNTMPAMDWHRLEDISALRPLSEKELRKLGRLPVPMARRHGEKGFRRISWDEAISLIVEKLRGIDPHRIAWYLTSRGLTNEAYYAHQKVARFIGTNHVDTSARICHAPSTAALSATVGCAATTCSYSDWIGSDLIVLVGTNLANNQPVTTKYLYYAKQAGTKIFVVNPYFEPGLERYAGHPRRDRPRLPGLSGHRQAAQEGRQLSVRERTLVDGSVQDPGRGRPFLTHRTAGGALGRESLSSFHAARKTVQQHCAPLV